MRLALRRIAFLFISALWAVPASADPLLFFLMSAAREIATSVAARQAGSPPAEANLPPAPEVATTYPGTAVEPATLRRVIDESFVYLSSAQRAEVFEKLNEMLLDPALGATRATLIQYFLHKALAVRAALIELERLSYSDKQRLAAEFRQETAALPEEERRQLVGLLEKNLLPVPADLNRLLLAQLQDNR